MQQLLSGIPDPWMNEYGIFYIPNNQFASRSGKWRLTGKADTCTYGFTTVGERTGLLMTNSSANSVKLTYSLTPTYDIPFSSLGVSISPFTWTITMWVYVGPDDFSTNLTTSNINTAGQYLGTFNFINKTNYEAKTAGNKQQMRVYIGRGSTTTLTCVVGRYQNTGSWQSIKINKSTNLTLSKGWHLVYIKPQSTRSTLVWGIDDQSFTNVTSFFNTGVDWTSDYYLGTDFCVSCSNRTSNLPRGPYRGFKGIVSNTDLADLYANDNW